MKARMRFSLLVLVMAAYLFVPMTSYGSPLEIYALDVGQGDSTLIITPDNNRILIDGGRDSTVITQLDNIIPVWDREIDLIMLSHSDADHLAGLLEVVDRFKVSAVAITPYIDKRELYRIFMKKLEYWNINKIPFTQFTQVTTEDNVMISSLWPEAKTVNNLSSNNSSQVSLVLFRKFTGLLTGDIDTEVANILESKEKLVDIDYLKVPHHGSKYGFTESQLHKLSPLISTISVGMNNSYGHPNKEMIKRLLDVGSLVQRTDYDKTILIKVDLSGISVSTE